MLSIYAYGVKGYPFPVAVMQPDGTSLNIRIYGDESFSYKTTLDGYIIAQGKDGFYYYADYNSGTLNISDLRVGQTGSRGYAKSVPFMHITPKNIYKNNRDRTLLQDLISTKAGVNMKTLVIPVQFADKKFTTVGIKSKLFNLFNQLNYSDNGATGSVRDYFRDNLGSSSNFMFDICDVVTLPRDFKYYGENVSEEVDKNIKELIKDACSLVDASVNFANYDYNYDGVVDNVFIIFAGHNEAEGGGDYTIWPQSWNVSSMQIYHDGLNISGFSCYSEYSGAFGERFAGIGTICHEYGHFLGLVDMYDVNGTTEGQSTGLHGSISIMDMGNYNNEGKTPPYFNIIERELMEITYLYPIREQQTIEVLPIQNASSGYRFTTEYSGENFYIEYRDGSKWDKYIGGEGIVVYHVDKTSNFAGSMSAKLRWKSNAVNACASHQCAYIVSSSGKSMNSVADAFFPGYNNVSALHSGYSFPLKSWSGTGVGFGLTHIMKGSNGMMATVEEDRGWDLPVVTGYSIEPDQTQARLRWSTDKEGYGHWNIVWSRDISIYPDTVAVYSKDYTLTNLVPGEKYNCYLFYSSGSTVGKVYSMDFQTTKMISKYPLIAEMDSLHNVGDTIRLHLLNLTEETESVIWYINNSLYRESVLSLDAEGIYSIKVEIIYKDGSTEILEKNLSVHGSTNKTTI